MTEGRSDYCTGALGSTSGALKAEVGQVMHSGKYYVTPELSRELQHINTGADHIRLEQHFRNNTQSWDGKFDANSSARLENGELI